MSSGCCSARHPALLDPGCALLKQLLLSCKEINICQRNKRKKDNSGRRGTVPPNFEAGVIYKKQQKKLNAERWKATQCMKANYFSGAFRSDDDVLCSLLALFLFLSENGKCPLKNSVESVVSALALSTAVVFSNCGGGLKIIRNSLRVEIGRRYMGVLFFNKEKKPQFYSLKLCYRCKRQLLLLTPQWLHSSFSFPVCMATEDGKVLFPRRCWYQWEGKTELNLCKTLRSPQSTEPGNRLTPWRVNVPSLVSESLRLEHLWWYPAQPPTPSTSSWAPPAEFWVSPKMESSSPLWTSVWGCLTTFMV